MSFALRVLVALAAILPLFAATALRPAWWQVAIAAAIGFGVGRLVVRATRGHRIAEGSVAAVAAIIIALSGGWSLTHAVPRVDSRREDASGNAFLIVAPRPAGRPSITWDDVRAIEHRLPSVALAVPYLRKRVQLISGDRNWNTQVVGTTAGFFDLMGLKVAAGDRFDASSSESAHRVVVLGDTVATQLYGVGKRPIGEVVRIGETPFTIIGVLARRGASRTGLDLDDSVLVPVHAFASTLGSSLTFGGAVLMSVKSPGDMAGVEAELRGLLRIRHQLGTYDEDDFIIRTANRE